MNRLFAPRNLFRAGLALLLLANLAILAGVAYNRSGKPEATLVLSERELRLPRTSNRENSGLALDLRWRVLPKDRASTATGSWHTPAWLDAGKLEDLGFTGIDVATLVNDWHRSRRFIAREVFIVLEFDGSAYREALRRAEMALQEVQQTGGSNAALDEDHRQRLQETEATLEQERDSASRLFAVDAGPDAGLLRKKYPDRKHHLIVRGLIEPTTLTDSGKTEIAGRIARISQTSIHIALRHRRVFDTLKAATAPRSNALKQPRYEVELHYGQRLEPWITAVRTLTTTP